MAPKEINEMVEGCRPQEDEVDRRILYEWTGMKLDSNDNYEEESSCEELLIDASVFIDNFIGYADFEDFVHESREEPLMATGMEQA